MSEWEKVYYAYKKAKYENILKNLQKFLPNIENLVFHTRKCACID